MGKVPHPRERFHQAPHVKSRMPHSQSLIKAGVIPKARAFTSAPRDLPLNSCMGVHGPGCPTSRAPFARDVGKFPAHHPIPQQRVKPGVIPKSPRFHQRGEGSPSPRTVGGHDPGCPTSRAPFARDVGKFPAHHPIPREKEKGALLFFGDRIGNPGSQ